MKRKHKFLIVVIILIIFSFLRSYYNSNYCSYWSDLYCDESELLKISYDEFTRCDKCVSLVTDRMFAIKLLQSHPENFSNIQHHFTNDRELLLFAIQKGYVPNLFIGGGGDTIAEIFLGDIELMRELSKYSEDGFIDFIHVPKAIRNDSIIMNNLLSKEPLLYNFMYDEIISTSTLKNYIKKWDINQLDEIIWLIVDADSITKISSDLKFMSQLSIPKKNYLTHEFRAIFEIDSMIKENSPH